MKTGYISNVIGLILLIILFIVMPTYYVGIITWAKDETGVIYDTRKLVDTVIDTKTLTEDMLADFNLSLASRSTYFSSTIKREVQVTNPDPDNPGSTYTAYVRADDITTWHSGDRITVTVEVVGSNALVSIARFMLRFVVPEDTIVLGAEVR